LIFYYSLDYPVIISNLIKLEISLAKWAIWQESKSLATKLIGMSCQTLVFALGIMVLHRQITYNGQSVLLAEPAGGWSQLNLPSMSCVERD